jgi:hypothetical protein
VESDSVGSRRMISAGFACPGRRKMSSIALDPYGDDRVDCYSRNVRPACY